MSLNVSKTHAAIWLGLGLLGGLVVANFLPSVPLHASTTDKIDTFSMATGPFGLQDEAVFFFDHLTGDLFAYSLGRTANGGGGVLARYYRNVSNDFNADSDKAKYLMCTGLSDMMRGGRNNSIQPSQGLLYIGELSSASFIAYYLPYNATTHRAGGIQPGVGEILPLCGPLPIRKPVGDMGHKNRKKSTADE